MKNKSLTPQIRFKGYDDEWKESTIEEHFTLYSGTTPSRSIPNAFCGSVNWISSGELKPHYIGETKEKIAEEVFRNSSLRLLPPGLLVIAIYGLEAAGVRGTASVTSVPTTISQACTAFIPNPRGEVDVEFLYGWYKHNGNYIGTHFAQGTKQQNLKSEIINELSICYPKGNEQKQIGKLICNLDSLIDDTEQEIIRLEKMKQASWQKIFPRPGETTPDVRIGSFNEPWKIRTIGSCFSEATGRGAHNNLLSVGITRGVYPTEDFVKTVTVKDFSNYKNVRENDIVYNSMRMWQGASGVSYYEGIVSPAYTVMTPREFIWSPFFAVYFKLPWVIKIFEANSQGLTKDTWNLKYPAISQIELPVPIDEKEQIYIAHFFNTLDSILSAKRQKLEKLQNLKQSCLDKMFINTTAQ